MKAIAVFKTDGHHSHGSRDLLAIASAMPYAFLVCQEQARKEGQSLNGDDEYNIFNIKQTQGYRGEGEFVLEEYEMDQLT